jgi:Fic family protein
MLQLASSGQATFQKTRLPITERIRGEFREMPGLLLTAPQACRLWSLDPSTCHSALAQLVEEGFLWRRSDGAYGRVSDTAARQRLTEAGN